MAATEIITKRLAISKTNTRMVASVGIAAFITIFCLVAAKSVASQTTYQGRVISAEDKANTQLTANIDAYNSLASHYNKFVSSSTNILGGQTSSTTSNGGNNAKVILDALPPSYDFPALTSTIEGILNNQGLSIASISGTDNELTEQNNNSSPSPAPISMPFSFSVNNMSYSQIGSLLTTLQQSVRPIAIDTLSVTGGSGDITLTINAHTYYQPAKNLSITQEEVK